MYVLLKSEVVKTVYKEKERKTMANELSQSKEPAIKQQKYDSKLQSIKFQHDQDSINYNKLVDDLNECELIRAANIPTVIIKNIAEFAMGRWKKCANNKCGEPVSILIEDTHKIYYYTIIDGEVIGEVGDNYPLMPKNVLHEMQSGALAVEPFHTFKSTTERMDEVGINRDWVVYCKKCRVYVKTCEECCQYCICGSCMCPGKFIICY